MNNTFIATYFNWDHRAPKKNHKFVNKILNKFGVDGRLCPKQPGMANVEARMNIFHLVRHVSVLQINGDVVEIGCNAGESSIVIQKVLNQYAPEKEFHVYDSFEGVPEINGEDAIDKVYRKGAMRVSEKILHRNFSEVGLALPHINKGWFEETIPSKLPDQISFAVIDADLYSSTKHVLPYVYERLSPGAICFFGIYYNEQIFRRDDTSKTFKSPGACRAINEFFIDKPESVSLLYANEYSNGFIQKE